MIIVRDPTMTNNVIVFTNFMGIVFTNFIVSTDSFSENFSEIPRSDDEGYNSDNNEDIQETLLKYR